jgi:hypothetical protein
MAKNSEHKKSIGNHLLVVKMIFKMQRQTNTNDMDVIQYSGSVDDIRCSLSNMNPVTGFEIRDDLDFLSRSLAYEVKNKNRVSVIKMLQAKINKVRKLKPGSQKNG